MSHSFHHQDTRFHFNSDYSGNIVINDKEGNRVEIPLADLEAFFANKIRKETYAKLEQILDNYPDKELIKNAMNAKNIESTVSEVVSTVESLFTKSKGIADILKTVLKDK